MGLIAVVAFVAVDGVGKSTERLFDRIAASLSNDVPVVAVGGAGGAGSGAGGDEDATDPVASNLYAVVDGSVHAVDPDTGAILNTVPGVSNASEAVLDDSGNLYVATQSVTKKYTPELASVVDLPGGVDADIHGNTLGLLNYNYVYPSYNSFIALYDLDGTPQGTVSLGTSDRRPEGVASDNAGGWLAIHADAYGASIYRRLVGAKADGTGVSYRHPTLTDWPSRCAVTSGFDVTLVGGEPGKIYAVCEVDIYNDRLLQLDVATMDDVSTRGIDWEVNLALSEIPEQMEYRDGAIYMLRGLDLTKRDANGNVDWTTTIGSDSDIAIAPDGSIFAIGWSQMQKIGADGTILWTEPVTGGREIAVR